MKQISTLVTERLGQAIANFDDEGINGVQCDERVAAVLEAVHQAHVGMITHEEMVAKIERALGGKLETDERTTTMDLTQDEIARYAPYHTMPAFAEGYEAYNAGKVPAFEIGGVAGQAYDRGAECAMRRGRAADWTKIHGTERPYR